MFPISTQPDGRYADSIPPCLFSNILTAGFPRSPTNPNSSVIFFPGWSKWVTPVFHILTRPDERYPVFRTGRNVVKLGVTPVYPMPSQASIWTCQLVAKTTVWQNGDFLVKLTCLLFGVLSPWFILSTLDIKQGKRYWNIPQWSLWCFLLHWRRPLALGPVRSAILGVRGNNFSKTFNVSRLADVMARSWKELD